MNDKSDLYLSHPQLVIHAGYSKCMSTWLQLLFQKHKEISYIHKSNFFQLYESNYCKGVRWYDNLFSNSYHHKVHLESDEHLMLPGINENIWINTNRLEDVEKVFRRIVKVNQKPKIVIVIRNQIDMILSRYFQFIKSGGRLDFGLFVDKTISNNNYKTNMFYKYFQVLSVVEKHVGKEQIFLLNLDDYRSKQIETLNNLSDFIGVNLLEHELPSREVNVSLSARGIKLNLLINKLLIIRKKTHTCKARARVPSLMWKIPVKLLEVIDKTLIKNKNKYSLFNPQNISEIKEIFWEDNMLLKKNWGVDYNDHPVFKEQP